MLESLFTSRWGGYVVMLLILGGITWLLRFLFGPKGMFRDPQWDTNNTEIRREEAKKREAKIRAWHEQHGELEKTTLAQELDIREHEQRFAEFTHPYLTGENDGPLKLKVVHSVRVLDHVRTLIKHESDVELARAALLAALYHDCGRFPQFQRYQTFQDGVSENHARLSLQATRDGLLDGETRRVCHLARTAILIHNRYALPERLTPEAARITYMLRDADKLDILRVMVQHLDDALPDRDAVLLSVQDEAGSWTPKVLEDVLAGRVARYSDLCYVNDFRLLLGTWLYELRFESTKRAMWDQGLMDAVLAGLPQDAAVQQAVEHLRGLREGVQVMA